ncbi:MAG: hypothetical protein QY328_18275 [Anaerolineales bacterium]|nr:MAG: hypothetical protein QY328_18275 [Anaerolineales bacterium]
MNVPVFLIVVEKVRAMGYRGTVSVPEDDGENLGGKTPPLRDHHL